MMPMRTGGPLRPIHRVCNPHTTDDRAISRYAWGDNSSRSALASPGPAARICCCRFREQHARPQRGVAMFRRPVWVILTLLLGACITIWVASYRHYSQVYWMRQMRDSGVRVDRGLAALWVNSQWADWAPRDGWHWEFGKVFRGQWPGILDLVHEFGLRHGQNGSVIIQAPMWSITLVAALPQLVFLRRRNCRRMGFPVCPVSEKN